MPASTCIACCWHVRIIALLLCKAQVGRLREQLAGLGRSQPAAWSGMQAGQDAAQRNHGCLGQIEDAGHASTAQRERLVRSTAVLGRSNERIQHSKQMLAEMEVACRVYLSENCSQTGTTLCTGRQPAMGMQGQGASILESLHGQRATMQRSKDKLQGVDENITASQKILKRMGRWLPF